MKKICFLLIVLLLAITGCSKTEPSGDLSDKYVGTWKAVKITKNGEDLKAEMEDYSLALDPGGVGVLTYEGELNVLGWEGTSEGVLLTMTEDEDHQIPCTVEGDQLTATYSEEISIVFKK